MNDGVKRYLDAVPAERKSIIDKLHQLIVGLYPDASVSMTYRMPTYKVHNGWVAVATQKRYISLYSPLPAFYLNSYRFEFINKPIPERFDVMAEDRLCISTHQMPAITR